MPLNLNGCICLLYSLFWGFLGLCWIKYIYPLLSVFILKIPNQLGKTITIVLTALLILNYSFSGLAVYRWKQRNQNIPASNAFFKTIDKFYPDEKMQKIYPNLSFIK